MFFDNIYLKFLFLFSFLFLAIGFGYSADCVNNFVLNNSCTLNSSKLYDNMTLKMIVPDNTCFKTAYSENNYFCGGNAKFNFKYTGSWGDDLDIYIEYTPKTNVTLANGNYYSSNNTTSHYSETSLNRDNLRDEASFTFRTKTTTNYQKLYNIIWTNTANEKDKIGYLDISLANTIKILNTISNKDICQNYSIDSANIIVCANLKYDYYGFKLTNINTAILENGCYKNIPNTWNPNTQLISLNINGYDKTISFEANKQTIPKPNYCLGSEPITDFTSDFENINCETMTNLPENYTCMESTTQPYLILDTTQNGLYKCNDQYFKKENKDVFICNNPNQTNTSADPNVCNRVQENKDGYTCTDGISSNLSFTNGNGLYSCGTNYFYYSGNKDAVEPCTKNSPSAGTGASAGTGSGAASASGNNISPVSTFWATFFTKLKTGFTKTTFNTNTASVATTTTQTTTTVCEGFDISLTGDTKWKYKCVSTTQAQSCTIANSTPNNVFDIAKVQNAAHKAELENICQAQKKT